MNEIAKIQLFHITATMPWAEVETTQHNIRLTYYDGEQENAPKTVLVLSKNEAIDIAKALNVLADNYCYNGKEEDEL